MSPLCTVNVALKKEELMVATFTNMALTARLQKLQAMLARREIDLAVLQFATDLYYYTGSVQPLYLLVPQTGDPCLVARKALTRITEEAPQLALSAFGGSKELAAIAERLGGTTAQRVACTLDTASSATVQRLARLFPQAEIVDCSWDMRTLRMVKDAEEIGILARAGQILAHIPALVREHFRPGITELELSAALEHAFRLQGHDMLIRSRREGMEMSACGVVSAGVRTLAGTKFEGICGGTGLSPAVPYGATRTPIAPGEPILIDIAFVLEGYHCDQTRQACWGQPSAAITRAYNAMLQIQHAVFAALRPGGTWEEIYALSAAMAADLGYADTYMGVGREQVKFVGHGVGLELDEPPFLAPGMPALLENGMTLAIEPKVALPGIGVIGIEDTVVMREDGMERLTPCAQEMVVLG